jgi:hypothetical protein
MGRYMDLPAQDRYGADAIAGDLAESKVAAVLAALDRPIHDFGPKRVDTSRAQAMTWPKEIRHMPDYLGFGRFIEVQGSNGDVVLFKEDKLNALVFWNALMPVWFGIYNTSTDEVLFADLASVLWACHHERAYRLTLDEGTRAEKQAFEVPIDVLYQVRFENAFAAEKAIRKKAVA